MVHVTDRAHVDVGLVRSNFTFAIFKLKSEQMPV